MANLDSVTQMEKLLYKKCCNYACECHCDTLRKLLGDAANQTRLRLGGNCDDLKND